MSFEPKKYQQVFEEMRLRSLESQVVTDFEVGSVVRTMYEAFSYELALMYEKMRLVYLAGFVDTAQGRDLEQVVAILGIQRGLPDYAEGMVTFTRDSGQDDIIIPLGTLVSTEETPESVDENGTPDNINRKKVYQTLKEQVLSASASTVEVKVRAVERGEEQETARETITVMPRPIPGIKSVINAEPIRFTGKGTETDQALRERAKNTLISGGKATGISIENALLGLSGVKDVRVHERFYKARGNVVLQRPQPVGVPPYDVIQIPRFTPISFTVPDPPNSDRVLQYQTTYQAFLGANETSLQLEIEALKEGPFFEIPDPGEIISAELGAMEGFAPASLTPGEITPLVQQDFGVIEVFVDGPDLGNAEEFGPINQTVDEVKAAGIYPIIRGVDKVILLAIFRIDLPESLNLTEEELAKLELEVAEAIKDFIAKLKMGEPLVFTKLISSILALEQVDNMDQFTIEVAKPHRPELTFPVYDLARRLIELENAERFDLEAAKVYVAATDKRLPLDLEFEASEGLSDDLEAETVALANYLGDLPKGISQELTEVASGIEAVLMYLGVAMVRATPLQIRSRSIYDRKVIREEGGTLNLVPSLVEQFTLGELFAYDTHIDLVGALDVNYANGLSQAEKTEIRNAHLLPAVDEYLNSFGREENIPLVGLANIASQLDSVQEIELNAEDFRAYLGEVYQPGAIENEEVIIGLKEKGRRVHLLVSDATEDIEIVISGVELRLQILSAEVTPPPTEEQIIAQAQRETINIINNHLNGFQPGQDVDMNDFQSAIGGASQGIDLTVEAFTLTATSVDGRVQTATLAHPQDIHVRSIERATMAPVSEEEITISLLPEPDSE